MGLFTKVFGTYSQRELKSIYPIVDKITALEEDYKKLTDAELQAKTPEFKARLTQGETLDDILPEAFATVREAADRVLGMRPYPVQLVGGIVLHQGRIAEMKTGEGKTLVATLPAYLNALTGEGVHIVVNLFDIERARVEKINLLLDFRPEGQDLGKGAVHPALQLGEFEEALFHGIEVSRHVIRNRGVPERP